MDDSDSESGNEVVDISGPQDLFSDEADKDEPVTKEDGAEENAVKPKEEESKAKVENKPKPKKVRNSSILSYKTLTKPSGLPALKKLFANFKFKGNGHEEEDLTRIMAILQHWMCFQLCPSYDFESCMVQLEALGKKRIVQTLMKKFRMGIDDWGETKLDNADQERRDDEMEICEPEPTGVRENEFDLLLNEEIANVDSEEELSPKAREIDTQQSTQKEAEVTLTPEQLERIARNRKLAEERRMKRMSQQEVTVNVESTIGNDSKIGPPEPDNT